MGLYEFSGKEAEQETKENYKAGILGAVAVCLFIIAPLALWAYLLLR